MLAPEASPASRGKVVGVMSIELQQQGPGAAVPGLTRSDPHGPGITRRWDDTRFRYDGPSGVPVTDAETLLRIGSLAIPPAWTNVWISPDPLGHIQATGVDSRGRTQYRYHRLWREQRDAQKFTHMLRFAGALPELRAATVHDLRRRDLNRDRVASGAVRLIDLGLFRIGGERYAALDHHYGATTLEKRHVTVTRHGIRFDYIAKEGKRREITVTDPAVLPTVRALASSDNGLDALFCWERDGTWHPLHSHDVTEYIAAEGRRALHREGVPHLERDRADGAAAGERGFTGHGARPQPGDRGQRPRRGRVARRHPGRGPHVVHRSPADQPLPGRRAAASDPRAARGAAGPRRGRGRGCRAARGRRLTSRRGSPGHQGGQEFR